MPRKPPRVATQSFRAAPSQEAVRTTPHGPIPYSKRVVRRKVHGTMSRRVPKSLRSFAL